MKKFFSFFALVLLSMSISAQTFTPTSEADMTQDGVTVSFAKGSGNNDPFWGNNGLRLYASNTITISGKTITSVQLVFTKQGTKTYADLTASVGTLTGGGESTGADDQKTDTWTGSASSVTFTLGASGQRLIKKIIVNGTPGGNPDPNPNPDPEPEPEPEPETNLDPTYVYAEPTIVSAGNLTAAIGNNMSYSFVENNILVSCSTGAIVRESTTLPDYFGCNAGNSITFTATQPIKAITVDGYIKKDFGATASNGDIVYADASEAEVEDELVLAVTDVNATTLTLNCDKQIRFYSISFYFESNPEIEIGGGDEEYSYEWEPTEVTTLNFTMDYFSAIDMTDNLGYKAVSIEMENDEAYLATVAFVDYDEACGITPGTYPINFTYEEGTVEASVGGDEDYDYETYLMTNFQIIDDEEWYDPYYIVSGTLTVAKTATDFTYTLNGLSYNGSTINVTYSGPLMTAIESVSKPAELNKRLVNGQLVITRGEQRYSVLGSRVK